MSYFDPSFNPYERAIARFLVGIALVLAILAVLTSPSDAQTYRIDPSDPECSDARNAAHGPWCSFWGLDHRVLPEGSTVHVAPGTYRWLIQREPETVLPGGIPRYNTIKLVPPGLTIDGGGKVVIEVASISPQPAFAATAGRSVVRWTGLEIRGVLRTDQGGLAYSPRVITSYEIDAMIFQKVKLGPHQGPIALDSWWDWKDVRERERGDIVRIQGTKLFVFDNSELVCMEDLPPAEEIGQHVSDGFKFYRAVNDDEDTENVVITDSRLRNCGHNVVFMRNGFYNIQRNVFECILWKCVDNYQNVNEGILSGNRFSSIGLVPMDKNWAPDDTGRSGNVPVAFKLARDSFNWKIMHNRFEDANPIEGYGFMSSGGHDVEIRNNVFIDAPWRIDPGGQTAWRVSDNTFIRRGIVRRGEPHHVYCDPEQWLDGNRFLHGATYEGEPCDSPSSD